MKKIRLGVIGVGSHGTGHVRNIRNGMTPEIEVAAICDVDPEAIARVQKEFGDIPAILMGDMNANENSQTYTKATETFVDTRHATENTSDACTFQNWGTVEKWIDYCFVSEDAFTVNSFAVVTDTYDGAHPSDHNPLSVSLTLNK